MGENAEARSHVDSTHQSTDTKQTQGSHFNISNGKYNINESQVTIVMTVCLSYFWLKFTYKKGGQQRRQRRRQIPRLTHSILTSSKAPQFTAHSFRSPHIKPVNWNGFCRKGIIHIWMKKQQ